MKFLKSFSLAICALFLLYSCGDQDAVNPTGDDSLIDAIESAANLQEVSVDALPTNATTTIDQEYTEEFVSTVELAPELGYRVRMRTGNGPDVGGCSNTYFDTSGNELLRTGAERPGRRRRHCFRLVFPFTMNMPDGASITLTERADWATVKDWFEANPDNEDRPTLVYPVDISFRNGESRTINNADEMRAAKGRCKDRRDG